MNLPKNILQIFQLSSAVAGQIPNQQYLKRTVQRIKNIVEIAPPNPQFYMFIIQKEFKLTFDIGKFLLFDSGDNGSYEDRILLFSTEIFLEIIFNTDHWFSDGTFSSCLHLFYRFFTIHGIYSCEIIPLVYALLPDKKETTYTKSFQVIIINYISSKIVYN